MIDHYLDLEGAGVVSTPSFLLAMANFQVAQKRRAITVFWGDTGLGKTVAARAAEELVGEENCAWLKLTTRPNPALLANGLLYLITGVEHDETRWRAARTLKRELADRELLIVIDEAQNLSLECIEWLRWLHEEMPGRFTLILAGGLNVARRLQSSRQLWRRVFRPTAFRPIPPALIEEHIRGFHPMYVDADEKTIELLTGHCKGNLGDWARVSVDCQEQLWERGGQTVTEAVAKLAISNDVTGRSIGASA